MDHCISILCHCFYLATRDLKLVFIFVKYLSLCPVNNGDMV